MRLSATLSRRGIPSTSLEVERVIIHTFSRDTRIVMQTRPLTLGNISRGRAAPARNHSPQAFASEKVGTNLITSMIWPFGMFVFGKTWCLIAASFTRLANCTVKAFLMQDSRKKICVCSSTERTTSDSDYTDVVTDKLCIRFGTRSLKASRDQASQKQFRVPSPKHAMMSEEAITIADSISSGKL